VRKAIRDLLDRTKGVSFRTPPKPEPVRRGEFQGRGNPGRRRVSDDGKLQCRLCEQWLPTTQYYIHHDKRKARLHHSSYCNDCRRMSYVARNHAISVEQYRQIISEASGHCQICKQEATLHVDHCHFTGKLRGLLCNRCNTALGSFLDDPTILRSAVKYVERYRALHATTAQTEQDIERERRMSKIRSSRK
jgi:Pyruvate/2-oxoacid:ferredoxin oxidoreductase delta subunit